MERNEKNNEEDAEFQIRFYESILKDNPEFVQALTVLGELYTKEGMYEKGLDVDLRLARLRPEDPFVLYNLACSYSLMQDIDKSLSAIKSAVLHGYEDFRYLECDTDLFNLRQDIRFKQFLSRVKNNDSTDKEKQAL